MSCLMVVGVAVAIIIRVAWAPILMGFALAGVTDVGTMIAIIIGAILLGAAALRERLSGRTF